MKVAFQCAQPHGSYFIGQETILDPDTDRTIIDPLFSNNEVEWYTDRIGSPVLYGLLIKIRLSFDAARGGRGEGGREEKRGKEEEKERKRKRKEKST